MIAPDDEKILQRQRRRMRLEANKNGYDYTTKYIDPATLYKRRPKYMPRSPESWEEVYD